jgi:hypothetical protein
MVMAGALAHCWIVGVADVGTGVEVGAEAEEEPQPARRQTAVRASTRRTKQFLRMIRMSSDATPWRTMGASSAGRPTVRSVPF